MALIQMRYRPTEQAFRIKVGADTLDLGASEQLKMVRARARAATLHNVNRLIKRLSEDTSKRQIQEGSIVGVLVPEKFKKKVPFRNVSGVVISSSNGYHRVR